jgi:hypothetical protein
MHKLSKDTGMIVIIYTTLWLASSFFLCLFSFWAGRCARKLPIIDENLPWTMRRDQGPRCTADCKTQHSAPPDPPSWPYSH